MSIYETTIISKTTGKTILKTRSFHKSSAEAISSALKITKANFGSKLHTVDRIHNVYNHFEEHGYEELDH